MYQFRVTEWEVAIRNDASWKNKFTTRRAAPVEHLVQEMNIRASEYVEKPFKQKWSSVLKIEHVVSCDSRICGFLFFIFFSQDT